MFVLCDTGCVRVIWLVGLGCLCCLVFSFVVRLLGLGLVVACCL